MFGKASLDSTRWQVRVADYHRPLEVKQIRPSEPTEECIFHNGKFSQVRQDRLATDSGGQQKEQREAIEQGGWSCALGGLMMRSPGVDLLVATPGRLRKMHARGQLFYTNVTRAAAAVVAEWRVGGDAGDRRGRYHVG